MPPVSIQTMAVLPYLIASGGAQMALDEALFELLDAENGSLPELIIRCYTWEPATWSIGRFQKHSDAMSHLIDNSPVVRRPTGGRAIFHNGDISFAFISKHPALLKMSVSESYCVFQKPLIQTLQALGIPLREACNAPPKKAYQTHDLCFETHLPSEILSEAGDKLCGMAQARRKHALLQHGAAFLAPWHIAPEAFETQLKKALSEVFQLTPDRIVTPQFDALPGLQARWQHLQETDYASSDSATIWDNASTRAGSHF